MKVITHSLLSCHVCRYLGGHEQEEVRRAIDQGRDLAKKMRASRDKWRAYAERLERHGELANITIAALNSQLLDVQRDCVEATKDRDANLRMYEAMRKERDDLRRRLDEFRFPIPRCGMQVWFTPRDSVYCTLERGHVGGFCGAFP